MFTWADLFWATMLIAFAAAMIYIADQEDQRPPRLQWVEDPRNGCVPRNAVPLANDGEIKQSKFVPKMLTVYDCKNGLTAALIEKQ